MRGRPEAVAAVYVIVLLACYFARLMLFSCLGVLSFAAENEDDLRKGRLDG